MKSTIPMLGKNSNHYLEILHGAAGSLLLKAVGAVVGFLFSLELARQLGPEGVGVFGLAVTTVTMCATVALCGMGQASLKIIAAEAAREAWPDVWRVARTALFVTLPIGLLLSAAFFIAREPIAIDLFQEPQLIPVLALFSIAVVPLTLRALAVSCLNGLKKLKSAVAVDTIVQPSIALLLFLFIIDQTVVGAAIAYLAGAVGSVLIGAWLWRRYTAALIAGPSDLAPRKLAREMLTLGIPTLGVVLGLSFGQWIVIYVLGFSSGSEAVGFYRVAFQITILLGFLLSATDSIMAPKISALHHRGELLDLARICRFAIFMMLLPGLPAVGVLLLFPGPILSIFGPDFVAATLALQILALGQLINLATGSVGTVLIMTGHERKSFLNSLFGAITALILSLILIPEFGATGAAAALALTMALRNLSATYLVWRFVGVNVWTGRINRHAAGPAD